MDALFAFFAILITLVSVLGVGATLGVDSRDGFADDRRPTTLR
jgi:hypothetical protein